MSLVYLIDPLIFNTSYSCVEKDFTKFKRSGLL